MVILEKMFILSVFIFFSTISQADGTNKTFSLCIIGDSGTGSNSQHDVAKVLNSSKCRRILHTGDVFYPNGVNSIYDPQWISKFEEPYKTLIDEGAVFYISLGNHDYSGGNSIDKIEMIHRSYSAKNSYYYFPSKFYRFNISDTCFWVIDTQNYSKEQSDFLKSTMAEKKCNWKIVVGHHPVKSSGKHGDGSWNLQKYLRPILEDYADFYISGHDHNLADEGIVSTKQNKGFVQLVSGSAAKTRPVNKCSNTGCSFISDSLGFIQLEILEKKLKVILVDEKSNVLFSKDYLK